MKKKETGVVHDTVILTIITLVAGLALGGVHMVTAGPIAATQQAAQDAAQKEVFPDADSFSEVESFDAAAFTEKLPDLGLDQTTVYSVSQASDAKGNKLGYVVDAGNNEGYGGEVELMAGIGVDDSGYTLKGISFLNLEETAGMGMRAEEPEFKDQFVDMALGEEISIKYTKAGKSAANEIDAISGATVTTNAVAKAVNGALQAVTTIEGGAE